jgi:hypothetical protein
MAASDQREGGLDRYAFIGLTSGWIMTRLVLVITLALLAVAALPSAASAQTTDKDWSGLRFADT